MRVFKILLFNLLALPLLAAGVTGKWNVVATDPDGNKIKSILVVEESDGKLKGTALYQDLKIPAQEPRIEDGTLIYKMPWEGGILLTIRLKVDGDKLKGTWSAENEGVSGDLTGERAKDEGSPVAGKWNAISTMPDGNEYEIPFEVKEQDGKLSGTMTTPEGSIPMEDIKFEGGELTCKLTVSMGVYQLKLKLEGNTLTGSASTQDGSAAKVRATR